MNKDNLSRTQIRATPSSLGSTSRQGKCQEKVFLTPGRIAVINGWLIAMLGVALYCAATLWGGVNDDSHFSGQGWMGTGALVLLGLGVGLWFYGAYLFLQDMDALPPDEGEENSF